MDFKQIIPLYIISIFSTLAASVVIPILSDLNTNYNLPWYKFFGVELFLTIGTIEAGFVLISTVSLLYWGYNVDKSNRQKIFIIGLILFLIGTLVVLINTHNLLYYIIGRGLFMATGLGSLGPAASSYAGDLLSFEKRSTINSTLSITGIGGIGVGIIISSILSEFYLFLPFVFLFFLGLALLILLIIYPEPIRGSEEPEIREVLTGKGSSVTRIKEIEDNYSQNVSLSSVQIILKRKTNLYVLLQGIFALIPSIIFSYYLISYLHDSHFGGIGLDLPLALILAMGPASGRLLGFPFFGWLGDHLNSSDNGSFKDKGRALVPMVTMFLQAPVMILAFMIVIPQVSPTVHQTLLGILSSNLPLILFGILFFIGAFIGGGSGPNRNSIIFDVNEPELRGQTTSILGIGDQLGAGVGLLLGNILIISHSYSYAFMLLSVGYFISALFWVGAYKSIEKDEKDLRLAIEKRTLSLQQLK